jgi:FkbM family methyltransferase
MNKYFILILLHTPTLFCGILDGVKIDTDEDKAFVRLGSNLYSNGESYIFNNIIKSFENPVVFDIGANKGLYTKMCLDINPDINIYSFEPVDEVYNYLFNKLNSYMELNKHIKIFNFGMYRINTKKDFWYAYNADGLSSIYDRSKEEAIINLGILYKKINVTLKTVDTFCAENNINRVHFMKIDTEGSELDVLLGATGMLKDRNIDCIQFEMGDTSYSAGITKKQICSLLDKFKYKIYKILPNSLVCIEWSERLEKNAHENYLAIRAEII